MMAPVVLADQTQYFILLLVPAAELGNTPGLAGLAGLAGGQDTPLPPPAELELPIRVLLEEIIHSALVLLIILPGAEAELVGLAGLQLQLLQAQVESG